MAAGLVQRPTDPTQTLPNGRLCGPSPMPPNEISALCCPGSSAPIDVTLSLMSTPR